MRSAAVLLAAVAIFAAFLLQTSSRAGDLIAREERALAALRVAAARPDRAPFEEGGYRFEWAGGGDLPELLVARPARRGEDGVRHFAARPDGTVYEFDTILFEAPRNRPEIRPLQVYLAIPPGERPESLRLFGWAKVD